MYPFKNLSGMIFGRLLVLRENGRNKWGKVMWMCRCECGNEKTIYSHSLVRGATRSCGCLQKEVALKTLEDYRSRKEVESHG